MFILRYWAMFVEVSLKMPIFTELVRSPSCMNGAALAYKQYIYLVGGHFEELDESEAPDREVVVYRYDIRYSKWQRLQPTMGFDTLAYYLPHDICGHSMVEYDDEFYVFGGFSRSELSCSNLLFVLSPAQCSWKACVDLPSAPSPRFAHAAAVVANTMYVIGGVNMEHVDYFQDSRIHAYSFLHKDWMVISCTGIPPCPRRGHSMHVWNRQLVVFGGYVQDDPATADLPNFHRDGMNGEITDDAVYTLDLDRCSWSFARPSDRSLDLNLASHVSFVYREHIYVSSFNESLNSWLIYDLKSHRWSRKRYVGAHPFLGARNGHVVCLAYDVAFIFGGRCKQENSNVCSGRQMCILKFLPTLRELCLASLINTHTRSKLNQLPHRLYEQLQQWTVDSIGTLNGVEVD